MFPADLPTTTPMRPVRISYRRDTLNFFPLSAAIQDLPDGRVLAQLTRGKASVDNLAPAVPVSYTADHKALVTSSTTSFVHVQTMKGWSQVVCVSDGTLTQTLVSDGRSTTESLDMLSAVENDRQPNIRTTSLLPGERHHPDSLPFRILRPDVFPKTPGDAGCPMFRQEIYTAKDSTTWTLLVECPTGRLTSWKATGTSYTVSGKSDTSVADGPWQGWPTDCTVRRLDPDGSVAQEVVFRDFHYDSPEAAKER